MTAPSEPAIPTLVLDLRGIPLDRLTEGDSSVLSHSIALYRERLKENGLTLSSFQARI